MNMIDEIALKFTSRNLAIFCGSGISLNSGIPIVHQFLEYLFQKIELTANEIKKISLADLPFESIMEMVVNESSLDEIQKLFMAGKPNTNHIFLAKLASKGYVLTICTTNFDLLIERAFETEGLIKGRDFEVYSSEADFKHISWNSDLIKIIKIHGCASKEEEIAITMQQIASDRFSISRNQIIEKIFNAGYDAVLVMGYSCSDLDLTPHIESIRSSKSKILMIEHVQGSKDGQIKTEPISLKAEKNPFKTYEGYRIFIDTDNFVKLTWESVLEEQYFHTSSGFFWKENIDRWYSTAEIQGGRGVNHHIASRLLYAIGAFKETIGHHKKAISIAQSNKNLKVYASEVGNLGMAHNALGEYEQAKFCFEESIPLCKRIGNVQGLAAQFQAFGNVLHHIGENRKAIELHKEALYYAELDEDQRCISNILGNMANALNALGKYDEAIEKIEKALSISRNVGNKQAESSQLGIIAISFLRQGKYEKSLNFNLEGIKIKRSIGDRQGEGQMLVNVVSIYNCLGKIKEAKQANEDCLTLAKQIGNKQLENMSLMQRALLS